MDDKTRILPKAKMAQGITPPAQVSNPPGGAAPSPAAEDEKTKLISINSAGQNDPAKTRVVSFNGGRSMLTPDPTSSTKEFSSTQPTSPMSKENTDPVVGWLVVVAGPGRGFSRELGIGMNSVGRASNQKIIIDFGDEEISRENHASVTFDPRGRKFYISPGGSRNLVYMKDAPVLMPQELVGGEDIVLGGTTVRFVPFCGPNFIWS